MDEFLLALPTVLWVGFLSVVLVAFRGPVRDLLSRISGVKALGVELSFVRAELTEAATTRGMSLQAQSEYSLVARASRVSDFLKSRTVLWVDDQPRLTDSEQNILEAFGIEVERALSSEEALSRLVRRRYDVVISDISRGAEPKAGLEMLSLMKENGLKNPVVFYVADLEVGKGTPAGAFGITNVPDELIHLVLDALERSPQPGRTT